MKRGLVFGSVAANLLLFAVVVAAFVVSAVSVTRLGDASRAENESTDVLSTASSLEKTVLDLETGLRGYLLAGEPRFLAPYRAATTVYPRLDAELERLTAGNAAQHDRAVLIAADIRSYVDAWAAPLVRRARRDLAGAQELEASGGGKTRIDEIRHRFAAFAGVQRQISAERSSQASRIGTIALVVVFVAMAVCALGVLILAYGARRFVALPIRRLAHVAARIGAGELSARAPEAGVAEVGELVTGFNAMADSLELQHVELENQAAELEAQQVELETVLQAVEEEKRDAELLRAFGDDLARAATLADAANTALRRVGDLAGAEVGAVYVADDGDEAYRLIARRGLAASTLAPTLAPGDGLAGRALAERRVVNVSYDEATMRLPGLATGRDALHELHLPLLHGDRTIGVVSLGRARDERFDPATVAMLGTLAERAALGLAEALSLHRAETLAHELETLLASTDEGIFGIDDAGRVTLVNRAALELTGYDEREIVGQDAHDLLHHTHAGGAPYPREECPIFHTTRTGVSSRIEGDLFWRKDGSSFPVEFSSSPLYDDGALVGAVVTFVDIGSRKRIERQRDTQHAITNVLADAPTTEDALPRLLEAVCEGFGWQLGFAWRPNTDATELRCAARFAASGWELESQRRSGSVVALGSGAAGAALASREPVVHARGDGAAVAVPIVGLHDRLLGVAEFFSEGPIERAGLLETLGSIAGQTAQYIERKRAELEIEQERQEFVATVSHELRTPLTAIDGWVHELLTEEPGPLNDDQRRFLLTVKRNSERLARLVGDLLVARQIETGRLDLFLAEVDVAEIVRDAAETLEAAAAAKEVELDASADGSVVVLGDRNRLAQLFGNLLSNAVKFTPAGGSVAIGVSVEDGSCRVSVTDTGIGIPPEDRGHLFERFYRASSATGLGIGGTGLGLAISKAIAEGHGGSIRLEDRAGPGTTFVVELPLAVRSEVRR